MEKLGAIKFEIKETKEKWIFVYERKDSYKATQSNIAAMFGLSYYQLNFWTTNAYDLSIGLHRIKS